MDWQSLMGLYASNAKKSAHKYFTNLEVSTLLVLITVVEKYPVERIIWELQQTDAGWIT